MIKKLINTFDLGGPNNSFAIAHYLPEIDHNAFQKICCFQSVIFHHLKVIGIEQEFLT